MGKEHVAVDGSDPQAAPVVAPIPDASNDDSNVPDDSFNPPVERPAFDNIRHGEVMSKITVVFKDRIKSLKCKACDRYFDSVCRKPITCNCKKTICRACFLLRTSPCGCDENIDTSCADLEVFSVIDGELSDLDLGIKDPLNTESMIEVLDALGIDLQRQYEGRMYYGKFMEDHTRQLEDISQNFSNDVVNYYKSCQILSEINESNAVETVNRALDELKTLSHSVDAINVALIKTFRLHMDETNMQIFLNLRTLNFTPALSEALRISNRPIWIVTTELGEEDHMFFKLTYNADEQTYFMHSIQKNMEGSIDPVIIDLKSFESQNLEKTGIFMNFAREYTDRPEPDHKERMFSFYFNDSNELLNRQVMLFCTGQRFRTYKNSLICLPSYGAVLSINPVSVLPKDSDYEDGLCVDVTEDSDLFDGIPDVSNIGGDPPSIGQIFVTRSNHKYSEISLAFGLQSGSKFSGKRFQVIASVELLNKTYYWVKVFFDSASIGNQKVYVVDCGAIYALRHS